MSSGYTRCIICGEEFEKSLINPEMLGCPHCIAKIQKTSYMHRAKARRVA